RQAETCRWCRVAQSARLHRVPLDGSSDIMRNGPVLETPTRHLTTNLCRRLAMPKRIAHTRHGGRNTRLYTIWCGIKDRCTNPNEKWFHNYGGRGIVVCVEWMTNFVPFREWALANGYRDNLTIERIDNDGPY